MCLFFVGHGAAFSSLSPFILGRFGDDSNIIFLTGQISFPFGYFAAGLISDRLRRIRSLLCVALVCHAFAQHMLFSAHSLQAAMVFSALLRFFVGVNVQLTTLATLEGGGTSGFARIRTSGTVGFFLVQGSLLLMEVFLEHHGTAVMSSQDTQRLAGQSGVVFLLLTILPALRIREERSSHDAYYFADVLRVLKQPATAAFFGLSFCFYFSYQLVDYYLGSFLEMAGGMKAVYAGWFLAVVLELPFLPLTGRISKRWGIHTLFYVSLSAGMMRYLWLCLHILDVVHIPVFYSQILHGIHYTGFFMGGVYWLRSLFSDHLFGTGSGAYTVLAASLGGMAGNFFYGWLLFPKSIHDYKGLTAIHFLPLFGSAVVIQLGIAFGFAFLRPPQAPAGTTAAFEDQNRAKRSVST